MDSAPHKSLVLLMVSAVIKSVGLIVVVSNRFFVGILRLLRIMLRTPSAAWGGVVSLLTSNFFCRSVPSPVHVLLLKLLYAFTKGNKYIKNAFKKFLDKMGRFLGKVFICSWFGHVFGPSNPNGIAMCRCCHEMWYQCDGKAVSRVDGANYGRRERRRVRKGMEGFMPKGGSV